MSDIPRPSITDLWESLGGQVLGREVGGWRKAKCVLHEDKNASAQIHEDDGKWRCFVCPNGYGDQIDLLMRVHGIGFAEAIGLAKELPGGSDGAVSESAHRRNGLLLGGAGSRPGRRNWVPGWKRG